MTQPNSGRDLLRLLLVLLIVVLALLRRLLILIVVLALLIVAVLLAVIILLCAQRARALNTMRKYRWRRPERRSDARSAPRQPHGCRRQAHAHADARSDLPLVVL